MVDLNLPPGFLVLEVGSGHNPHPRSDILCDSFLDDNTERQHMAIRHDRPLVIADGEHLPFKNKAFDFVLCSQVIEHAVDPIAFAREISRVGKAGLIITPQAARERIFGWPYHRWYWTLKNDTLLFSPKKTDEQTATGDFMHRLAGTDLSFQRFLAQQETKLNIHYFWKNNIKIRSNIAPKAEVLSRADQQAGIILKKFSPSLTKDLNFFLAAKQTGGKNFLIKRRRQWQWNIKKLLRPSLNLDSLLELIVCPVCRRELSADKNRLLCQTCHKSYPVKNGLPIFLNKRI